MPSYRLAAWLTTCVIITTAKIDPSVAPIVHTTVVSPAYPISSRKFTTSLGLVEIDEISEESGPLWVRG